MKDGGAERNEDGSTVLVSRSRTRSTNAALSDFVLCKGKNTFRRADRGWMCVARKRRFGSFLLRARFKYVRGWRRASLLPDGYAFCDVSTWLC